MTNDISYKKFVNKELISAFYKIMQNIQSTDISPNRCLYISFYTNFPGVILSDRVKRKYPTDITIVLQHQYSNLQALKDEFLVTLSFDNMSETIKVPFAALIRFSDPINDFSIKFIADDIENKILGKNHNFQKIEKISIDAPKTEIQDTGNVIQFDKFRLKNRDEKSK